MDEKLVVEVVLDDSQLKTSLQESTKGGKVEKALADAYAKTNDELRERTNLMNQTTDAQKKATTETNKQTKSLDDLDAATRDLFKTFANSFIEQYSADLAVATKEINRLKEVEKSATTETSKLKKQVEDLTNKVDALAKKKKQSGNETKAYSQEIQRLNRELVKLELSGQSNTAQAEEYRAKLVQLKKAVKDVNDTTQFTASSTNVFDGLISGATAATSVYATAQGAAALLGDENEDLQASILKVNAAMSTLQGLQQVSTVLNSKSQASLLLLNIQRQIEVAQLNLSSAAQSKNIVIKGAAIVAQRALNLVMAANPIGIVITALAALSAAIIYYTSNAKQAAIEQGNLNAALASATIGLDAAVESYEDSSRRIVSDLEARGAKESQILSEQQRLRMQKLAEYEREIADLRLAIANSTEADTKEASDRLLQLEADANKLKTDQYVAYNELRKTLDRERDEADKKRIEDQKKRDAEALEARRQALQTQLDQKLYDQLGLDETSQKFITLQKEIIATRAQLDALGKSGISAELAIAQGGQEAAKYISGLRGQIEQNEIATTDRIIAEAPKRISALRAIADAQLTMSQETFDAESYLMDQRIQKIQQFVGEASQIYGMLASSFFAVGQEQEKNEQIRIENERKRVDERLELGEITAKEAEKQRQKLERDSRILARQQAQREKTQALFGALVSVAQATANALTAAKPPFNFLLAGAVAAFGLAQVNAIRNRPLPNYYRGKKEHDNYEGPAHVAEFGPELRERKGRLYLETKPTIANVSRDEIIYDAQTTKKMLSNGVKIKGGSFMRSREKFESAPVSFDSVSIGREIAKQIPGINLSWDKDGFNVAVHDGLNKINYLDKRRSFK